LGIENLLRVDGLLRPFGFEFLPMAKDRSDISRPVTLSRSQPVPSESSEMPKFDFDVAGGLKCILARGLAGIYPLSPVVLEPPDCASLFICGQSYYHYFLPMQVVAISFVLALSLQPRQIVA